MGIGSVISDRKCKERCELLNETKNPAKKSRRRRRKMSPVQRLYDTCKEVFVSAGTGFVPPASEIQRLQSILDNMTAADVGLSPDMPYFRNIAGDESPPFVTYLHLHECDKFSIGLFCLPPSAVIPLHNHPGMTVFSKLLFGTMHIKAYDWANDETSGTVDHLNPQSPGVQLAKVKVDSDFTAPCNASILYPADGGNMHCFTAVTSCAVLDVLGPPYSDPDGRHCTYYLDFPFSNFAVDEVSVPEEEREDYVWLQEREPDDFTVVGALYNGPKIVE